LPGLICIYQAHLSLLDAEWFVSSSINIFAAVFRFECGAKKQTNEHVLLVQSIGFHILVHGPTLPDYETLECLLNTHPEIQRVASKIKAILLRAKVTKIYIFIASFTTVSQRIASVNDPHKEH